MHPVMHKALYLLPLSTCLSRHMGQEQLLCWHPGKNPALRKTNPPCCKKSPIYLKNFVKDRIHVAGEAQGNKSSSVFLFWNNAFREKLYVPKLVIFRVS